MSTREIGEVLGVDHSTVVRDGNPPGADAPAEREETPPDAEPVTERGANAPQPEPSIREQLENELPEEAREKLADDQVLLLFEKALAAPAAYS